MSPDRPSPEPDAVSAPFFAALAQGRLFLQCCKACSTWQLGALACHGCDAPELEWLPASGRGTISALTRMHIAYQPAFKADIPYDAATVELEEGPRIHASIVGAKPTEARIGLPVVLKIDVLATGISVPVFEPAE